MHSAAEWSVWLCPRRLRSVHVRLFPLGAGTANNHPHVELGSLGSAGGKAAGKKARPPCREPSTGCAGRCQLDMALYSEDHVAGGQEPVYPINAVRNRALQMVQTQVRRPTPRPNVLQMGVHTAQQSIIWGALPVSCILHPAATPARAACPCDWYANSRQAVDARGGIAACCFWGQFLAPSAREPEGLQPLPDFCR